MNEIAVIPIKKDFIDALSNYILTLKKGRDFSKICVVFPGKRPCLFLKKYLGDKVERPFIPPNMFSIDEFMEFLFSLKRVERIPEGEIDLIYLLYRAIRKGNFAKGNGLSHLSRSMDLFIEWGEKILKSMEEIEIEWARGIEIEKLIEYDENIIEWAKDFWSNFIKIKETFHNLLIENKITYRGEVYRWVSENIEDIEPLIPFEKIIFAGFYALNRSEDKVMRHLFERNRADILIQSDGVNKEITKTSPYYFHYKWKEEWGVDFKNIAEGSGEKPYIKIYQGFDTHSEVLTVNRILKLSHNKDADTAVVLPDSSPLIPLINEVIGSNKDDFNITLGYPISRTSLSNLTKYIFSLQITKRKKADEYFYYAPDYLNLLLHPYIKTLKIGKENEDFRILIHSVEKLLIEKNRREIKTFFSLREIEEGFDKEISDIFNNQSRFREAKNELKRVHDLFIRRLEGLKLPDKGAEVISECLQFVYENTSIKNHPLTNQFIGAIFKKLEEIRMSLFASTHSLDSAFEKSEQMIRFLDNYLDNSRIPFVGEPLQGIQIMGLLETRNLNFNKVVILDVNEGVVPEIKKYDPILPQHFRYAIGLPDYTEKESIYSYNFSRLINGAKEVHLLYKEGKLQDTDENIKSRFIERIVWEKEKNCEDLDIKNLIFPVKNVWYAREFPKNEEILKYLLNMEYSASAIDTYINCPLRFYSKYVLRLEEWEEIEKEIERSTIGIFVHKFLKDYYKQFLNKKLSIDKNRFMNTLEKSLEERFKEGGGCIIIREIIKKTLERFINFEIERTEGNDIIIRKLEEELNSKIDIDGEKFSLKGWIDRVEEIEGIYNIIDYKTGLILKPNKKKLSLEDAESRESIRKTIKSLQLPVYMYLYSQEMNIALDNISAQYFNIRKPWEDNSINNDKMDILMNSLRFILKEITDINVQFEPDSSNERYCRHCPYKLICPEDIVKLE
ncbi:PD-(D/E)XK nuclease family protein [candidate division WOR-3 bacterium]|nr:PD-(D/E)XK nuclease family protein [candidate division WOR-3 bacterium]